MTNKKAVAFVIDTFGADMPADVKEKLESILASLNKKSASKKSTKTQEENKVFADKVLDILADGQGRTITEILKADEMFADLSNQKMTAVVRGLVNDGVVTKTKDGKKSIFAVAE